MTPIYFDTNATTPIDPAVRAAMLPFLSEEFGNPSSAHALGRRAHDAVEHARRQVASLIGAEPDEIVFTGCGTEASNLAIKGVAFAQREAGHFIASAIEHPATLKPLEFLQRLGARITIVPVDRDGLVDPAAIAAAIEPETVLVSVMHANNETGTIQPIREIAAECRRRGVLVHTDAAQSLGKIAVDVNEMGVDLLTMAGHKVYAPKGVGALYVRRGVRLEALIHGGGQECGRRSGTENVALIVGFGDACGVGAKRQSGDRFNMARLRDRLWVALKSALGDRVVSLGHPDRRLPNTLYAAFLGHVGSELLARAPEIAASTGSACHDGRHSMSPVLMAMGIDPAVGRGAIRLCVGRFTTDDDVDRAAALLAARAREE